MAKTITVFGVDSLLGGAVAKALTSRFKVKGVTLGSGLSASKAESLTSAGVQITSGNDDFKSILADTHGCFLTLQSDLQNPGVHKDEVRLGRQIADACRAAAVKHVVFDTKLSPVRILGMAARHMDAKTDIEDYMKSIDLPLTCIVCPLFYQHFLVPPLKPRKIDDFSFSLELPIGIHSLDFVDADDVGTILTEIFHQGAPYYGKTLNLSGDKLTINEIAACLSACLPPKIFIAKQVTIEQYREGEFPGSEDLSVMFDFYTRVDQRASIDATQRLCPALQSLDSWLQRNSASIAQQMN